MSNFFTINGGKSNRKSEDETKFTVLAIFLKYLEEPICIEGPDALIIHQIVEEALKKKKEIVSVSQYFGHEITRTIRVSDIFYMQLFGDKEDLEEGWRTEPGVYHNYTK